MIDSTEGKEDEVAHSKSDSAETVTPSRSWGVIREWAALSLSIIAILLHVDQYRMDKAQAEPKIEIDYRTSLPLKYENFRTGWLLTNKGGRANIRWSALSIDGEPVETWEEAERALPLRIDSVGPRSHAPERGLQYEQGEERLLFAVTSDHASELTAVHRRALIEVCYCSLAGDCWKASSRMPISTESDCELNGALALRERTFRPVLKTDRDTVPDNVAVRIWLEDNYGEPYRRPNLTVKYMNSYNQVACTSRDSETAYSCRLAYDHDRSGVRENQLTGVLFESGLEEWYGSSQTFNSTPATIYTVPD